MHFTLFLFLFVEFVFAQEPDTIISYEYIYITNTIWIEKPKKRTDTIPITRLNTKNQKIFYDLPATILENSIYPIETNKNEDMKKIAFLGLTILLINSNAFCQNEWKDNLSLFLKANMASQLHSYSDEALTELFEKTTDGDELGEYIEEYLLSPGIGISTEKKSTLL